MKKNVLFILVLALSLFSCKNEEVIEAEVEELIVEEVVEVVSDTLEIVEEDEVMFDMYYKVEKNLIYCENSDFTISIDRLLNGDLRYIAWNKPKAISEIPDLVLYDGRAESQGTSGGFHFIFDNIVCRYMIKNDILQDNPNEKDIFLLVKKYDEILRYTEMSDLKK